MYCFITGYVFTGVSLSTGGRAWEGACVVAGGHAWLPGDMHGCRGRAWLQGGGGVAGVWLLGIVSGCRGVCVVAGGMHG